MKKRMAILLILLVFIISGSGCSARKDDLKFYVLSGSEVSEKMSDDALFALAKKKGRIAFSGEDLAGWLWTEQKVQLLPPNVIGESGRGGSVLFQTTGEDYFLITLRGKVVYSGGFVRAQSDSRPPRNPYIRDTGEGSVFEICFDARFGGEDPRNQARLYRFLADQQLLVSSF